MSDDGVTSDGGMSLCDDVDVSDCEGNPGVSGGEHGVSAGMSGGDHGVSGSPGVSNSVGDNWSHILQRGMMILSK